MKNLIMKRITDSVQERLGDTYRVTTQDVVKNNGLILKGLVIRHEEESLSPTIYLDDFVDDFLHGTPLNAITDRILQIYYKNRNEHFDVSSLLDFNSVKDKIIYQLINTSQNEEFLKDTPSIPYLDLSIIFKVLIDSSQQAVSTVTIHNSLLEMWNTSTDEIYSLAKENTPKIMPAQITSMTDILKQAFKTGVFPTEQPEIFDAPDICPMYVLSNFNLLHGSGCILYPNVLCNFAKASDADIYILPSSVNEVILIPDVAKMLKADELKDMVHQVNCTEVAEEEFLSDSVYFYSRETQELSQL